MIAQLKLLSGFELTFGCWKISGNVNNTWTYSPSNNWNAMILFSFPKLSLE